MGVVTHAMTSHTKGKTVNERPSRPAEDYSQVKQKMSQLSVHGILIVEGAFIVEVCFGPGQE